MDTLILFGKQLLEDTTISWVAESRCKLAMELLRKHHGVRLIISGGRTSSDKSEASVMRNYILSHMDVSSRIDVEEDGLSTVHQLVIIKTAYLTPNGVRKVALISDEIHIPRIELVAKHLLGKNFEVQSFGSEVRISGHYRRAMVEFESKLYKLTLSNPVLNNYHLVQA